MVFLSHFLSLIDGFTPPRLPLIIRHQQLRFPIEDKVFPTICEDTNVPECVLECVT